MTEHRMARMLRDSVRHLLVAHGALDGARRPCGAELPLPHAHALLELLHHDAPLTVAELAAKLDIDRTNVSRLCSRMERAGHLSRRPDPADARARALRLTARGKKLARSVDDLSARHFERLVQDLGPVDGIVSALDRLTQAMARAAEGA